MLAATVSGDLSITSFARLMHTAENESWSGRVTFDGSRSGTLVFSGGQLCFGGIGGWVPLMVRLADDDLFTPEEWSATLEASSIPPRWSTLVGGDGDRLARIEEQVRDDIVTTVRWLSESESGAFGFSPGRPHPFGVLTTMELDEVAELADVDLEPTVDLPTSFPTGDFLELLREVNGVG
jgi:hypothetical protein